MFHIVVLVIAAVLWIAYGIYRFRKPEFQHYSWKLISYLLGGGVLGWYEIHMYWYWLVLGVLFVVFAMFDKTQTEK